MTKIIFSSAFTRALKKLLNAQPNLEPLIRERFDTFQKDPIDPSLHTHRLGGDLKKYRSFRITYDIRVIFEFTKDGEAIFSDIGTHNDVY